MGMIKKISIVCSLLLAISFNNAFAGSERVIDSANSVVSFSIIKEEYVVEPAIFRNVEGTISKEGHLEVNIDLNSVETYITIRNARVKESFFNTEKFPQARLTAKIDMKELESISHYKRMKIPATLKFYGKNKKITLHVLVAKVCEDKLLFTSMRPLIVNSKDYGIPAKNLKKLSKNIGGASISGKVSTNFVFSFKEVK